MDFCDSIGKPLKSATLENVASNYAAEIEKAANNKPGVADLATENAVHKMLAETQNQVDQRPFFQEGPLPLDYSGRRQVLRRVENLLDENFCRDGGGQPRLRIVSDPKLTSWQQIDLLMPNQQRTNYYTIPILRDQGR